MNFYILIILYRARNYNNVTGTEESRGKCAVHCCQVLLYMIEQEQFMESLPPCTVGIVAQYGQFHSMDSFTLWILAQQGQFHSRDSFTVWTVSQYGQLHSMDSFTVWIVAQYVQLHSMDSYYCLHNRYSNILPFINIKYRNTDRQTNRPIDQKTYKVRMEQKNTEIFSKKGFIWGNFSFFCLLRKETQVFRTV